MSRVIVMGTRAPNSTAREVVIAAERRGHSTLVIDPLVERPVLADAVAGADAVVLIPPRGNAWKTTLAPTTQLIQVAAATSREARKPLHLLLMSSFAVGHGRAHPLNRIDKMLLPARVAAEQELRDGPLPHTIVRATWLTSDPRGAHAVALTQDPYADGMVSRADIAELFVAAIDDPAARDTTFAAFNQPFAPDAPSYEFNALRRDCGDGTPEARDD